MLTSPNQWILPAMVVTLVGGVTTAMVLSMDAPVVVNEEGAPQNLPTPVALRNPEVPDRATRRGMEPLPKRTFTTESLDAIIALHDTGDHTTSRAALKTWLSTHKTDPDIALATALLGVWQSQAGHHKDALNTLGTSEPPPLFEDITWAARAHSMRAVGRAEDAVTPLTAIMGQARSPLAPQAELDRADALFEATRYERALSRYEEGLKHYPVYPRRWNARLRMAICLEHLGRVGEGILLHRRIQREVPESEAGVQAAQALARLQTAGQSVPAWRLSDDIEWGTQLRKDRRWADAVVFLDGLVPRLTSRRDKANVHWERGKALESLERFEEAHTALRTAKSFGFSSRRVRRAHAKILQKQGKTAKAVRMARRLERRTEEAEKVAAKLFREGGLFKEAAVLFQRHLDPDQKVQDAWLTHWMNYRNGRLNNAERGFRQLASRNRSIAQKARYWLGRTQQRRKRLNHAKHSFKAVASANARSYYGVQAISRLLEMGLDDWVMEHTGAKSTHLPSQDDRKASRGTVHWLSFDGSALAPSPKERRPNEFMALANRWMPAFVAIQRASIRYRLGFDELARHELRIAVSEYKRTRTGRARTLALQPTRLYVDNRKKKTGLWGSPLGRTQRLSPQSLAREIQRIETIRSVPQAFLMDAYQLLAMAGDPWGERKKAFGGHARTLRGVPTDETTPIFRNGFPFPYEETLRRETQEHGQSLYLMSAIARVESAFNALAISSANARGLVQVLPVTGNLIARERKDWEFSAEDLLKPEVGIRYGTWYLAQLLKKFHGQEALAIASYNAGPHRMAEWLRLRGKKTVLDEFIEDIPYKQARRYVKKVLSLVGLYRRIYEQVPVLYIGNRIDTQYEDNINW